MHSCQSLLATRYRHNVMVPGSGVLARPQMTAIDLYRAESQNLERALTGFCNGALTKVTAQGQVAMKPNFHFN